MQPRPRSECFVTRLSRILAVEEVAASPIVQLRQSHLPLAAALLVSFSLFSLPASARAEIAEQDTTSPRRIRNIRVVRNNVFDRAETDRHAIFRIANALHLSTREHVVRRALLFAEGDLVDLDLLAATERALRAYDFINTARVVVVPVDAATVDVEVHTHDSWTLVPGILFETGGGLSKLGLTVTENNLAGFGKRVFLEGVHTTDEGTSFSASYDDPQVLGSRWIAHSNFKTGPLIDSVSLAFLHPFYSPDTKWAYGGFGNWHEEKVRSFEAGSEVSRIQESRRAAQIFVSRALGRRFSKLTVELEYRYSDSRFEQIGDFEAVLPEDEFSLTTSLGLFFRSESFVEAEHIHKMTLIEDIRLGFIVGARLGRAGFPIPEGDEYWNIAGIYDHAFMLGDSQYFFLTSRGSTQDSRNTLLSVSGKYYYRSTSWQTLAFRVEVRRAWDLGTSRQFDLGGDNGLRGFSARQFNGDKSFLLNAESRFYSPVEILTLAIGAVVFIDGGRAWGRGEPIDLEELKYSAGFGLRLGFTRAPNEPMTRIDIGWPLNGSGWAVTVGSEHQF